MTSDQELLQVVAEAVAEVLGLPAEQVTPERRFAEDLDADELDQIEIVMTLEERLGVSISDEDLSTMGLGTDLTAPAATSLEQISLSSRFQDFESRARAVIGRGTVQDLIDYLRTATT